MALWSWTRHSRRSTRRCPSSSVVMSAESQPTDLVPVKDEDEAALVAPGGKRRRKRQVVKRSKPIPAVRERNSALDGKRSFVPRPPTQEELQEQLQKAESIMQIDAPKADLPAPQLIPFLPQPKYQKLGFANIAGDAGFDPIGFSSSRDNFSFMRLAELKHARWAMLAAVGWPLSELVNPPLAEALGLPSGVLTNGCCPAFLNGGWPLVEQTFFVGLAFFGAAFGDFVLDQKDMTGRYNIDPLELKNLEIPVASMLVPEGRNMMAEAEMLNGRIAMLAIASMVLQEYFLKKPVIAQGLFGLW